jgi:hypothetical protein
MPGGKKEDCYQAKNDGNYDSLQAKRIQKSHGVYMVS